MMPPTRGATTCLEVEILQVRHSGPLTGFGAPGVPSGLAALGGALVAIHGVLRGFGEEALTLRGSFEVLGSCGHGGPFRLSGPVGRFDRVNVSWPPTVSYRSFGSFAMGRSAYGQWSFGL